MRAKRSRAPRNDGGACDGSPERRWRCRSWRRWDGKIAHLDGLNFSRAWCWRSLATTFAENDSRREVALAAAESYIAASLPHVADDYAGEHWLATFATLALEA